ncbi:hypothetical protein ACOMHN_060508 [Nucella lapillus]
MPVTGLPVIVEKFLIALLTDNTVSSWKDQVEYVYNLKDNTCVNRSAPMFPLRCLPGYHLSGSFYQDIVEISGDETATDNDFVLPEACLQSTRFSEFPKECSHTASTLTRQRMCKEHAVYPQADQFLSV